MHRRVQNLMNEKFVVPDLDGQLGRKWFNHYDVSLTQFAFIGLAMIWPQKSGFIAASDEELELVNYYWRVLGYLMGVKDEFNCCQFDKYADIQAFNKLIFQHEYLESYDKTKCKTGLEMTQAICLALKDFMPTLTFNSLAYWWRDCFNFNGYEVKPLSAKERLLNFSTSLSFNHLFKYEGFLKFVVKVHKSRFETKLKNKDKIYKKLKREYENKTEYTFLSDRVDYFANGNDAKKLDNLNADIEVGGCPFGFGAAPKSNPETMVAA